MLRPVIYFFIFLFGCCGTVLPQSVVTAKPDFRKAVEQRLGRALSGVCPVDTDKTARRIFTEYGAVFIASAKVILPPTCIFSGEEGVQQFQAGANLRTVVINNDSITLQAPAMEALIKARRKAALAGLSISPKGGPTGATRSYENTRTFWKEKFLNGLANWTGRGLSKDEANAAKLLSTEDQIAQVLEWENTRHLYFSKYFNKSILYSVAAPGASQHNFSLAIDIKDDEHKLKKVQEIMAEFGWFQTVKSDLPHFTYLGRAESELLSLGLQKVPAEGRDFWIPAFK